MPESGLINTILSSSRAFIDSTVVNVALPTLQTQLNATVSDVQWVEAYARFVAALILFKSEHSTIAIGWFDKSLYPSHLDARHRR
jgi:hypothetical protein